MQKRIRAQQKIQMRLRPVEFLLEMPHRFYRVIHFAARMPRSRLGKRSDKSRVVRTGERHHRVAVGVGGHSAAMLVRRTACRDEMNFVEVKGAAPGTCGFQGGKVNPIKRAAKQRNPTLAYRHGRRSVASRR